MSDRPLLLVLLAPLLAASLAAQSADAQAAGSDRGGAAVRAHARADVRAAVSASARKRGSPARVVSTESDDVLVGRQLRGGRQPSSVKAESDVIRPGVPVEIPPHGQCRFEVSVSPDKLLAGQTGKVKIVMVLQADSVMEEPTDLVIALPEDRDGEDHSMLSLGGARVHPPQPSQLAAAYRGRQVYDNWAVVELPVTMSAEARLGSRQSIDVEASFRLHQASTGMLFGDYRHRITISCEVGASLDPAVEQAAAGRAVRTDRGNGRRSPSQAPQASDDNPRAGLEPRPAALGRSEDARQDDGAPPELDQLTGSSVGWQPLLMTIAGAGLLMIALLALYARRR